MSRNVPTTQSPLGLLKRRGAWGSPEVVAALSYVHAIVLETPVMPVTPGKRIKGLLRTRILTGFSSPRPGGLKHYERGIILLNSTD